jgi:type VI secretion system secreted protein Hcp
LAVIASLTVTGQNQGEIKESVIVFAVDHLLQRSYDPTTGQVTGNTAHHPIKITKEVDKASVPFYSALTTNENLPEWELKFWRLKNTGRNSGAEFQYFTIKPSNARVVSIHLVKPNTKVRDLNPLPDYEEIEFTYQKIEWTWTDGGITALDDWESPIT